MEEIKKETTQEVSVQEQSIGQVCADTIFAGSLVTDNE